MENRVAKVDLVCAECGGGFRLYPSQTLNGRGKFCSRECLTASKRHGSTLHCCLCDTEFYRRYGEQDREVRKSQFCSRECYQEWRALHRKATTYMKVGTRHAHRVVAEAVLRRPLAPGEVVHHIDNNKHNNNPANLAVFPDQSHHARCHGGGMSNAELRRFHLKTIAARRKSRL